MPETAFRTAPASAEGDAPPARAQLPSRPRAERAPVGAAKSVLRPLKWRYRLATAGRRVLPGAIVVGAQKSGTSALYAYLIRHPSVACAMAKEVHYFDVNYGRGPDWYRAHFHTLTHVERLRRRHGVDPVAVEASPYYLAHPLAPDRVRGLLPAVKLIVLLREPVSRAVSHYNHEVQVGIEELPFDEAVQREAERLDPALERLNAEPLHVSFNHRHFSYLARGRYAEQLERWLALFPRERLLILDHAKLLHEPASTMRRVWEFLELPADDRPDGYEAWGARQYVTDVETEHRDRLADYFDPHNARLWELIGETFEWGAGA